MKDFWGGGWIQNSWGGCGKSAEQQVAEQLKAGPMTVEKQTISKNRRRGAFTRGADGYIVGDVSGDAIL